MNSDLNWILKSPALMKTPEGLYSMKQLTEQLQIPQSIKSDDLAINTPKRLGIYYENLVEILLNKSPQPIVLKRNLQVKKEKITLGEFDFIGSTETIEFHLECAIKYYLRVGPGNQLQDYIGPGKKDRLDIKWHRLVSHQLPLSSTEEGSATCRNHGISPQSKVMLLQGYLFHPYKEGAPERLADEINPDHLQGWWLHQSEICELGQDYQYSTMNKPFWLTPKDLQVMELDGLESHLEALNHPTLITRGKWKDGEWIEKDRVFVVPDTW